MKMKHHAVAASLGFMLMGTAAGGAVMEKSSSTAETSAASAIPMAALLLQAQAEPQKPSTTATEAPLTRDQVLKEGPATLEKTCTQCHGSDKWEGTNRDHDGWAAIVATMSKQMADAQMPPMSDRTANLIIDYLTLTHPQ